MGTVELDKIPDPETGLALVSKRPDDETPEQERTRLFWQFQFMQWRAFRAGDVLAFERALICCSDFGRPPPRWMREAGFELCERNMSGDDKRSYGDLTRQVLRWQAVELVRGRRPWDARNRKKKIRGDRCWVAASKMLAGTVAKASAETVRGSYKLIKHAGGQHVTLQSYKQAVAERDRRRRRKKI